MSDAPHSQNPVAPRAFALWATGRSARNKWLAAPPLAFGRSNLFLLHLLHFELAAPKMTARSYVFSLLFALGGGPCF